MLLMQGPIRLLVQIITNVFRFFYRLKSFPYQQPLSELSKTGSKTKNCLLGSKHIFNSKCRKWTIACFNEVYVLKLNKPYQKTIKIYC